MARANVFNIQKFSLNDGPGIRTVVFVKGCPLKCLWCHNPESKSAKREMFYDAKKCINCGKCADSCGEGGHLFREDKHFFNREGCVLCGKCAAVCPSGALEICGKEMSAEEALIEVMKDEIFYETSGGGVTVSGGEPLYSFDFTYELLSLAKEAGYELNPEQLEGIAGGWCGNHCYVMYD
jgi:pyruvate formate lyase activating enzyme